MIRRKWENLMTDVGSSFKPTQLEPFMDRLEGLNNQSTDLACYFTEI